MPYNPFSRLDLYSNTFPRTCGPSRFSPVCVYDRYNVIGSSAPSLITPVKALEFGTRLNGPSAKENVVGRPPSGTLMIDSPEIGRAAFAQKGCCLLRLTPSAILFSNCCGNLAFQLIFHLLLSMFDRPYSIAASCRYATNSCHRSWFENSMSTTNVLRSRVARLQLVSFCIIAEGSLGLFGEPLKWLD